MNTRLILDGEAPIYEAELRGKDHPYLKVAIAKELKMAEPLVQGMAIIFGIPALVAAVLDVYEQEPLPDDRPFWTTDNVMGTLPNSAYSILHKVAEIFADNYARYPAGSPLDYLVDFTRGC